MMSAVLGTIPAMLEGTEEFSIHSLGSSHQLCLVASHKNAVLQRNPKPFRANSNHSVLQTGQDRTGQQSHQKTFQCPRGEIQLQHFCPTSPAWGLSSPSTLMLFQQDFPSTAPCWTEQAPSEQSLGSGLLVPKSSWLQALPVPDNSFSNTESSLQCTCPESVL